MHFLGVILQVQKNLARIIPTHTLSHVFRPRFVDAYLDCRSNMLNCNSVRVQDLLFTSIEYFLFDFRRKPVVIHSSIETDRTEFDMIKSNQFNLRSARNKLKFPYKTTLLFLLTSVLILLSFYDQSIYWFKKM